MPRVVLAAFVAAWLLVPAARAQDKDKIDAAKKFLTDKARAQAVLFFMHPSAEYKDVAVVGRLDVVDARKAKREGWFCLKLRFDWKSGLFGDSHSSHLLAFFDDKGRLSELQAGDTTTFVKPFAASDVVLAAVKEKLLEEIKDEDDRKILRRLIADGDAKALLTWLLKAAQK